MKQIFLEIVLDTPLDAAFDYRWNVADTEPMPREGQLALVPFGRRETVGMIVRVKEASDVPPARLKDALGVRTQLVPLAAEWIALCQFAADYYQRPLGEVALPALPKGLRAATTVALDKAIKKLDGAGVPPAKRRAKAKAKAKAAASDAAAMAAVAVDGGDESVADDASMPGAAAQTQLHSPAASVAPTLNAAQQAAVDAVTQAQGFKPVLLFGVTGSGKTEVYLHAVEALLARAKEAGEGAQVLILVPEINLTPQLEHNIRARFPNETISTLHSGLAEGERLRHWLAAHQGKASIVLGTRLAILASLPHLKLIVIDEEHDPSYKQQEGLRYSARDLAVWRAHQLGIAVVLGSATPSLETWYHASSGRYTQLTLRERASHAAVLPRVYAIDTERDKPGDGITSTLMQAIKRRLDCGEQSLLYLNRRGYAPVLSCDACGWISDCKRCTAFMVLHKPEHRLRCHHCSLELRIPRSCPTCGNVDLQPLGRGTQRVEESLTQMFPQARLLRIDADSTRLKGSAQAAFDSVHRGDVDILIGTQMVAKGHDFRNLTLVGVLNPDTALFSHDYRAAERLFAQLMQVAGRAGRAGQKEGGNPSEVLIQTRYPQHALYAALMAHDYELFAKTLLTERRDAGLPPFVYQALLRAEARELQTALDFLEQAAHCLQHEGIVILDPIPMTLTRVANVERAQLLIESASRPALQAFMKEWLAILKTIKTRARWSLEVDPVDI